MGAARLLAKGWIAFCLYAGALAFGAAIISPTSGPSGTILVCLLLFGAMGILFISGYGLSAAHLHPTLSPAIKLQNLLPGFSELVFVAFAMILLLVQLFLAPAFYEGPAVEAVERAIRFAVVDQRTLETALMQCRIVGGRLFVSSLAWTLALIFLGSALSTIRLRASLVRFERKKRPEVLGAQALAFALGLVAVAGIQFLYVGTAYALLPCHVLGGLFGAAVIGIGPLMLAYLIFAALTTLLALGPEA